MVIARQFWEVKFRTRDKRQDENQQTRNMLIHTYYRNCCDSFSYVFYRFKEGRGKAGCMDTPE